MSSNQEKVAEFREKHDMEATAAFRLIDVFAEIGEIASDAVKSADYGMSEEELEVEADELGDAMFSLLSLAESLDVDIDDALETSLEKYRERIETSGSAGSGK